jgi:hypothetical protein
VANRIGHAQTLHDRAGNAVGTGADLTGQIDSMAPLIATTFGFSAETAWEDITGMDQVSPHPLRICFP